MKTSRYTVSQILSILRQAEGGMPVAELCREHGMSNASFHIYGCLAHCKVLVELFRRHVGLQTSIRRHRSMVRPNGNSARRASTNGRPQQAIIKARFLTHRSLPVGSFL